MTDFPQPSMPESEKLLAIKDKSQIIGEFLDWLRSEQEVTLCTLDESEDQFYPVFVSIEDLLAEYFGIDLQKVEQEKVALLEALRETYR